MPLIMLLFFFCWWSAETMKAIVFIWEKAVISKTWRLLTCIKVFPFHGGVDIGGSEIEDFDKIVKPITQNQCNGNKNLQQQNEKKVKIKIKALKVG